MDKILKKRLPFASFKENVEIFISHSKDDTLAARKYEKLLIENGFKEAWAYEKRIDIGEEIDPIVEQKINKCDFFILLVSENSRKSTWVQRELGLAIKLSREADNFRPIILPICLSAPTGSAKFAPFPCKDYVTGEDRHESYSLDKRRALDEDSPADTVDVLIDQVTPKLSLAGRDITKRGDLIGTGVFEIYESLFPINERIPTQRLINLVFNAREDEFPVISLKDDQGNAIDYRLCRETIMLVLTISGRAIGFIIFNYNHETCLFFGSYLGVHSCWRSYDTAGSIIAEAENRISNEERYSGHKGFVFEVERIDFKKVISILVELEDGNKNKIDFSKQDDFRLDEYGDDEKIDSDAGVIRKFLRVVLYGELGASLFVDENNNPLEYVQPCMDLGLSRNDWRMAESKLWLMFVPPRNKWSADAGELWRDVVNFIVVEHIGKTYASYNRHIGFEYLKYTESLRDAVLDGALSRKVNLMQPSEKFGMLDILAHRWAKLGIRIKL
jgi:hypothetical protein